MKLSATAIGVALMMAFAPLMSFADVAISINIAPPALPVYVQPELPGDGYIWTPGYWAWDGDDYYWVPGTWVLPPRAGLLWTPAWWAWDGEAYQFRAGYWGSSVGYYGGIDYGYGYSGRGYQGGRWDHDHFYYNRAVNHIDRSRIRDSYRQDVVRRGPADHRSYNGGDGGTRSRPSDHGRERERDDNRQDRFEATADQTRHEQVARERPDLRRRSNQGLPPVAATPQPGVLDDRRVTRARGPSPPQHQPGNSAPWQQPTPQRPTAPPDRPLNGSRPGEPGTGDHEQHDRRPEARPAREPGHSWQQEQRQPMQPDRPQNGSRPGEAGPNDSQQREQRVDPGPRPEPRQQEQRRQEQRQQPAQSEHPPQDGSRRSEGGAQQREQHDQR